MPEREVVAAPAGERIGRADHFYRRALAVLDKAEFGSPAPSPRAARYLAYLGQPSQREA